MAVTIIERPYDYSFSENYIRYVLMVDNPAVPGCAVEFELYYGKYDILANSIKIITFALTPENDGSIYCHIADYLKSVLSPQLPAVNGALVQPAEDQCRYFFIKYRQVTTADSTAAFVSDLHLKIIIMGGVEKAKFKRNNFFVSYFQATKTFLTWQKNTYVYINQPHYLTFLNAPYKANFTVNVKTVFVDKSIDTSKTQAVAANFNTIFRINAGAKAWALDAINPAKKIYYYEISITDVDNNVLANPHRFYINYYPVYRFWDFNYFNSLGGIDPVRVSEQTEIDVELQSEQQEHVTIKDSYDTDKPQPQFSTTNIVKTDNYKGDAGFMYNPKAREVLIELLMARGIYEQVDGRWIKILNLKKSQSLGTSTDTKWSFAIEWSYGYEDRVFTPKDILLGNGTMEAIIGPTCSPVIIPSVTLPDATATSPYSFSITLGGDAPFVVTPTAKPDWMTISVLGNTVSFTGTPTAVATGITVSFDVTNCGGHNNASFSDTIDVGAYLGNAPVTNMIIEAVVLPSPVQDSGTYAWSVRVHISSPTGITAQSDIRVVGELTEHGSSGGNTAAFDITIVAGTDLTQNDYVITTGRFGSVSVAINSVSPTSVVGSDGNTYNVIY